MNSNKLALIALLTATTASAQTFKPLPERVNVQADTARMNQIIDGSWVAVGIDKPEAVGYDYKIPYKGLPSYRFSLGTQDNTLEGYSEGETKGRAELCRCYATATDYQNLPQADYTAAQRCKTVYMRGKGICPQGSSRTYRFAVWIPSTMSRNVQTIFAQWHGMPDRTLVTTPSGEMKRLSMTDFLTMEDTVVIKKDTAFERIASTDKNGRTIYKAGKPTGWLVEQGGYPPLAFGFSEGWFYIKANSDRRWFTDKSDRCNASPSKYGAMQSAHSEFKTSTIAYRLPFEEFPKDCWVEFTVRIDWSLYGGESQKIIRTGRLDVEMTADKKNRHIVNNEPIEIGRNDEDGYYFKFGIYRVGGSTEPVSYNLAGYSEE